MVYDVDYRECVVPDDDVAANMVEQGADTLGAFVVPTTASRITEIRIGLGSVSAAQDAVLAASCGVHLYGGGIKVSEGWFPGPLHTESGAAATSAGYSMNALMKYKTNIPVSPGGVFNAQAWLYGEDLADAHMILLVEYDGVPGRIVDCDHREVDIGAAANTLYTFVNRGGQAEYDFKPNYNRILEVVCGAAPDVTGGDVGVNTMPTFHLSGAGLLNAGNYKFVGPTGFSLGDTDISGPSMTKNLERYICGGNGIPVKPGGSIRAQGQNIESVQAMHAIIGLCYG